MRCLCVLKLLDEVYVRILPGTPTSALTSSMAIILQLCSLATPLPARSRIRPGVATTTCTLHPASKQFRRKSSSSRLGVGHQYAKEQGHAIAYVSTSLALATHAVTPSELQATMGHIPV